MSRAYQLHLQESPREEMTEWPVLGRRAKSHRTGAETRDNLRDLNRLDDWHGIGAVRYDYIVIAGSIWATIQLTW